jgi:hypothetical protein
MKNPQSMIGKKFGYGTIIAYTGKRTIGKKTKRAYDEFELLCDCGSKYKTTEQHLLGGLTNSCGCLRRQNLSNVRFGKLIVISFHGHHITSGGRSKVLWNCKCDCGNTTVVSADSLRIGDTSSCGCGIKSFHCTSGNTKSLQRYYTHLKYGADKRKIEFNITKEDLESLLIRQNNKCSLSNLEISLSDGTASVDRIDNNKGYIVNNIQFIYRPINYMKNTLSNNEFLRLCCLIAENNPRQIV